MPKKNVHYDVIRLDKLYHSSFWVTFWALASDSKNGSLTAEKTSPLINFRFPGNGTQIKTFIYKINGPYYSITSRKLIVIYSCNKEFTTRCFEKNININLDENLFSLIKSGTNVSWVRMSKVGCEENFQLFLSISYSNILRMYWKKNSLKKIIFSSFRCTVLSTFVVQIDLMKIGNSFILQIHEKT